MDPLTQCPYEPSHQIRLSRLQFHLVKCAKQHPNSNLVVCPFNCTHFIEKAEYNRHCQVCPDIITVLHSTHKLEREDLAINKLASIDDVPVVQMSENWDNDPVTTSYNPEEYTLKNNITRLHIGLSKSKKKEIRAQERHRINLHSKNASSTSSVSSEDPVPDKQIISEIPTKSNEAEQIEQQQRNNKTSDNSCSNYSNNHCQNRSDKQTNKETENCTNINLQSLREALLKVEKENELENENKIEEKKSEIVEEDEDKSTTIKLEKSINASVAGSSANFSGFGRGRAFHEQLARAIERQLTIRGSGSSISSSVAEEESDFLTTTSFFADDDE